MGSFPLITGWDPGIFTARDPGRPRARSQSLKALSGRARVGARRPPRRRAVRTPPGRAWRARASCAARRLHGEVEGDVRGDARDAVRREAAHDRVRVRDLRPRRRRDDVRVDVHARADDACKDVARDGPRPLLARFEPHARRGGDDGDGMHELPVLVGLGAHRGHPREHAQPVHEAAGGLEVLHARPGVCCVHQSRTNATTAKGPRKSLHDQSSTRRMAVGCRTLLTTVISSAMIMPVICAGYTLSMMCRRYASACWTRSARARGRSLHRRS